MLAPALQGGSSPPRRFAAVGSAVWYLTPWPRDRQCRSLRTGAGGSACSWGFSETKLGGLAGRRSRVTVGGLGALAAKNFSGGNQQKIVVAREIERNPDLLLIGQPTRGVDIGAIEFIHKQIVALRDQGKAILLVSVELEEIMSLSDRIAVMFDGAIMGERLPEQTNVQDLGLLMAGVAGKAA